MRAFGKLARITSALQGWSSFEKDSVKLFSGSANVVEVYCSRRVSSRGCLTAVLLGAGAGQSRIVPRLSTSRRAGLIRDWEVYAELYM